MSQTMRQAMSLRRQVQPVNRGDRPANRGVCPTGAWLLLALVLAPAAHAQFELFLVEGSTERAAPPVYDFGSLYADETASAHFRLRNTSSAPATLNVLAVAGMVSTSGVSFWMV